MEFRTLEKIDGSLGNPSFPDSLTRFFSPFLSFSSSPSFSSSSSPTKPHRSSRQLDLWSLARSIYDDIIFFLGVFAFHHPSLLFFFSSSFFCFPMKLVRHHRGPLPHHYRPCHPRGGLASRRHAPMVPGKRATLHGGFSYCSAVWGVRSSRVVSTLMPKCGLGRVVLTWFQPNLKKTNNNNNFFLHPIC